MWMNQQQAMDVDSASDTEAKDRKSEKLQPPSASSGHQGHWMYIVLFRFVRELYILYTPHLLKLINDFSIMEHSVMLKTFCVIIFF